MECAICSSTNVVVIREPRKFLFRRNSAIIEVEMYQCDDCGEEFLDPAQARAVSQKARDAGVLPPNVTCFVPAHLINPTP